MNNGILSKIKNINATKSQKKIIDYILNNEKYAAYMTASKLSETVGVSEATVVRFAFSLGFDGYPQFQKQLQLEIKNQLTSVERMEIVAEHTNKDDFIKMFLKTDMEKIEKTIGTLSSDDFSLAAEKIKNANKIYIVGVRSSAALAVFAGFYFNLLFDNTKVITGSGAEDITEQLFHIKSGDVVIGISFPRYSSGIVKAMEFAKNRGAFVIALTDSMASPIVSHSSCKLIALSSMESFTDSLVAPMSVLNALIFTISYSLGDKTKKIFTELEELWKDYEVYDSE